MLKRFHTLSDALAVILKGTILSSDRTASEIITVALDNNILQSRDDRDEVIR
ncbi:MAG: hypothetical protein ACI8XW_003719 [Gammaproteobacteria bacterium]|jgi:hypothetical protein